MSKINFPSKFFKSITILFVELDELDQVLPAKLSNNNGTTIPVSKTIDAINSVVIHMNIIFSCFDRLIDGHPVYKV